MIEGGCGRLLNQIARSAELRRASVSWTGGRRGGVVRGATQILTSMSNDDTIGLVILMPSVGV